MKTTDDDGDDHNEEFFENFSVVSMVRLFRAVVAAPVPSAAPKKKHLIETAPFGRLDQMPRTTEQRRKNKI